uniref:Uncharacterized protein n=1 Tax=Knipowitschia caucasica TaxID=637954 RepID=A0AAV2LUL4_KNICA
MQKATRAYAVPPYPPSPSASSIGQTTTTQVTITYPSQTLTRVCGPDEDPIIKLIVLKRWKEAASHALKHKHLQEELKEGIINLILKECELQDCWKHPKARRTFICQIKTAPQPPDRKTAV